MIQTAQPTALYQFSSVDFQEIVDSVATEKIQKMFSLVRIDTETVCELWKITRTTLSRYIKEGKIEPIGKRGNNNLFYLSEVLLNNPKYKQTP